MTLGSEDSDLIEEYGLPKPDAITLKSHQLANIVELPLDKLEQIYKKVCDTHKRLIIRKWVNGYYENKNVGYRDINKMNLLNDLSGGALSHILDDMNEQRRMRRS
jgi:ornithine cyclodeaminase/alanine dehydrogenase-like protein (mu-crystallin family)